VPQWDNCIWHSAVSLLVKKSFQTQKLAEPIKWLFKVADQFVSHSALKIIKSKCKTHTSNYPNNQAKWLLRDSAWFQGKWKTFTGLGLSNVQICGKLHICLAESKKNPKDFAPENECWFDFLPFLSSYNLTTMSQECPFQKMEFTVPFMYTKHTRDLKANYWPAGPGGCGPRRRGSLGGSPQHVRAQGPSYKRRIQQLVLDPYQGRSAGTHQKSQNEPNQDPYLWCDKVRQSLEECHSFTENNVWRYHLTMC